LKKPDHTDMASCFSVADFSLNDGERGRAAGADDDVCGAAGGAAATADGAGAAAAAEAPSERL
jgi:hypothetical protein